MSVRLAVIDSFRGCILVTDGIFGQIRLPEVELIWRKFFKPRVFEILPFACCFFVTDGRIDVGVGAIEMFCAFWQFRQDSITGNWHNLTCVWFYHHTHIVTNFNLNARAQSLLILIERFITKS